MKKRIVSLISALALCLGLFITADAATPTIPPVSIDGAPVYAGESGDGWDLQYDESNSIFVLTLNNFKGNVIDIELSMKIVLAPGSQNSISHLLMVYNPRTMYPELNDSGIVTFTGTGELSLDGSLFPDHLSPIYGQFGDIKFEDNLVMTGGENAGNGNSLVLGPEKAYDEMLGKSRMVTTQDGQVVQYIRIASSSANSASTSPSNPPSAVSEEDPYWTVAINGFDDVPKDSPYNRAITWAVEFGFAKGKTPRTFGPNDPCKISHILTFLYRDYTIPNEYQATLSEREAVANWAKQDFPKLITDADNLDGFCTRAMAVTFLWKLAGSPVPAKTTSFADIPADAPYAQAVAWAVERGVTNGYGANFLPDKICTRGQIVTFMMRARIVSEG